MNESYEPVLLRTRFSVFTFGMRVTDTLDPNDKGMPEIVKLFADDNDLQQITICSTNIGFVWTLRKMFRRKAGDDSPYPTGISFAFQEWIADILAPWFVPRRDFEDQRAILSVK